MKLLLLHNRVEVSVSILLVARSPRLFTFTSAFGKGLDSFLAILVTISPPSMCLECWYFSFARTPYGDTATWAAHQTECFVVAGWTVVRTGWLKLVRSTAGSAAAVSSMSLL